MSAETMTTFDPQMLGFFVKCLRKAENQSQEALAVACGLDVRTIQRVEAGEPSSVQTRRSLAKGLGYENRDTFDDPTFIATVSDMFRTLHENKLKEEYPDTLRVPCRPASGGAELLRMAAIAGGIMPHTDDNLSPGAREEAACLFDYMRDAGDILDDVPFSARLDFERELSEIQKRLDSCGGAIFVGQRAVNLVGRNWVDKTPMPMTIVYILVTVKGNDPKELLVPKGVSFG